MGAPIATSAEIKAYLAEVIDEEGIDKKIQYNHRIGSASWSSKTNLWTLEVLDTKADQLRTHTCNFLFMCQGYYGHQVRWIKGFD